MLPVVLEFGLEKESGCPKISEFTKSQPRLRMSVTGRRGPV